MALAEAEAVRVLVTTDMVCFWVKVDGVASDAEEMMDAEEGTLIVGTTADGLGWALDTALTEETTTDWTDDWAEDDGAADEDGIGSTTDDEDTAEEKGIKLLSGGR